jgi:hypothetical protein
MFSEDHMKKAEDSPSLGPAYFSGREFAERLMSTATGKELDGIAQDLSSKIYATLQSALQDHLINDTESSIQSHIWGSVDEMVRYLLAGEEWAIKRYVLNERYNAEKIRAAIARHIPDDVRNARIADLEAQVEKLRNDLKFYQNR